MKIVINAEGESVPLKWYMERYENKLGPVHIVFIRSDGWKLGAPKQFESTAYETWQDQWTEFCIARDPLPIRPIKEYKP